jgi:hypothetical protein
MSFCCHSSWRYSARVDPADPGPADHDPCLFVDGIAGARSNLAAAPSADIANGAPTGADATDEIVLTWVDGRDGLNDEHVMVSYSTNQGASWSAPTAVEQRAPAVATTRHPPCHRTARICICVYNAFTTRLRGHCRQHGLHLAELARRVVEGSFTLDV